ncbi:discoidin domain-containing protein [Paenibacillus sp. 2TAB23]|uniref:discoidin domain-containing protein n=1 Tax=Paenibacillus sp. 2TAB23 TaxID=3233004 RepID=UPI003F9C5610
MFKTMYGKGILFVIIFSLLLSGNVFVPPTKALAATNLALGKSVTASSTESSSYPASYAVDGNPSTRWSSSYTDQQNFIIDLGSVQSVSSVVLKWEAAYASQFQIQTSLDNASWTTVYSNYNGSGGTNTINFTSTNARYVKLYAFQRATAYGYSLYEIEVYGNPSNLALGKSVTASSVESASYAAANAVDGNSATRWSSAVVDQQNFVVDLGTAQTVSSVILKWESAYASQYQIQTSTDNASWTTVYANYSATGGTNTITFPATNARYIKLYAFQRATAYGYSLYEFEVYGSGTPASSIGVLDYINSISGSKTVIGIHNREPNATPAVQTNAVTNITGRYPGLWSGDFLFSSSDISNRWTMIYEAKKQWDNGAIVNIMMHVTPPTQSDSGNWNGGVVSSLSNAQWTDLITNGGALNQAWKARLDNYAQYLQYLEDQNVTVLFRPFHEMNQGIFWWAGRPGANGTAALYRLTHDYLENTKGLSNLVWVWDMQDLDLNWSVYNPGSSYWDIFALDVYNPDGFTTAKYNAALAVAGNKPIAIGECDKLPTASQLLAQPRWTFVMSWAELTFSSNTNAQIQALYGASNVITRDELPDLH